MLLQFLISNILQLISSFARNGLTTQRFLLYDVVINMT